MDETTPMSGGPGRQVLAGRYTLRGLLGRGGMADVQLAQDEVLDRQVAVKLLHQRYTDDPAFVERFKREARAAASLNHPNMVAVYDTGESDGRPFIVMEYVAGRTLQDVLRHEGVLPARAAEITADAALALHYAHERGLVHRDVKPANIMLSDEGQVKVTDFGIARAVNAETITQTAAVFGTAAYIAPEQARGGAVDARTDVYSLGVVLYEMLTGQQPFSGDSAVALAYKHVSENPTVPSQINPEITSEMEAVVLKAMAKDPDDRYPDARAFHSDLQRALQGLTVSAPPALAYATTRALGADRTMVATAPAAYDEPELDDEEIAEREHRGGRRLAAALLVLLVLAAFALAGYLLVQLLESQTPTLVRVPDVTGQPLQRAQQTLQTAGFETEVQRTNNRRVDRGDVIRTDPPADEEVEEGSRVTLIVSDGPPTARVPEIIGLLENEAVAAIQDAGLAVGSRDEERSDDADAGEVIAADPEPGTQLEEGERVDYAVAGGPATVVIPDVRGQSRDAAEQALREDCGDPPCLSITVERSFDDDVDQGDAIGTDPGDGTRVEYGSTVVLVISRGPEPEPEPEPTEEEPPPPEEPPPTDAPTELPTDAATEQTQGG